MKTGLQNTNNLMKWVPWTVYTLLILYFGKLLFVPLSFALFISFILYPICKWLEQRGLSKVLAIGVCLTLFTIFIVGLLWILVYQFLEFMKNWPVLQLKLNQMIADLDQWIASSYFSDFIDTEKGVLHSLMEYIINFGIPTLPGHIYQSSISFMMLLLIPLYIALILYYRKILTEFLYRIFPGSAKEQIRKILPDVIVTYYNFVKGMALVYLIVGILNSIGLAVLGIPNPIFFGFIASILTFIPYVGIAIGALLPMTASWLMYDSMFYPLGVVVVFGIVQILEANVIFPLAVSYHLKINALMILIVVIAGGILWGAMGMILFMPFVAILKLVSDQVEVLHPFSVLLGTGKEIIEDS